MISFPLSRVKKFVKRDNNLRYGQEFYVFMALEKVTNPADVVFCDRLYEADGDLAKAMIASVTDPNQ